MAERPSTRVLPHELPASLREAGLDNWIREPLDDAVDRRRRIIMPPAVSVLGTPAPRPPGPAAGRGEAPRHAVHDGRQPGAAHDAGTADAAGFLPAQVRPDPAHPPAAERAGGPGE